MSSLPGNRAVRILDAAAKHHFAVPALCVYNLEGIMAAIRAAENRQSPLIIQLFPWAMRFYGRAFIDMAVRIAHESSVTIAVQLDHCIKEEDVHLALEMPFDSIMIDGSLFDAEENILYTKRITKIALSKGIAVEAEIGRIEGGEDGLPTVDLDTIMSDPYEAVDYVIQSGVQFLAPSFGNVHGSYPPEGPKWDLNRCKSILEKLDGRARLVLHGTHGVKDDLFLECVKLGFTKINLNKSIRERYTEFLEEKAGRMELTKQIEQGIDVYSKEIERYMDLFGSSGKQYLVNK